MCWLGVGLDSAFSSLAFSWAATESLGLNAVFCVPATWPITMRLSWRLLISQRLSLSFKPFTWDSGGWLCAAATENPAAEPPATSQCRSQSGLRPLAVWHRVVQGHCWSGGAIVCVFWFGLDLGLSVLLLLLPQGKKRRKQSLTVDHIWPRSGR